MGEREKERERKVRIKKGRGRAGYCAEAKVVVRDRQRIRET